MRKKNITLTAIGRIKNLRKKQERIAKKKKDAPVPKKSLDSWEISKLISSNEDATQERIRHQARYYRSWL